jgi:MraZ protein
MNLIGEYPVSMDEKSRIRMPSGLLRQLPAPASEAAGYEFVVNRGFDACLTLYPKAVWDELTERIKKLNQFNERQRHFVRAFYASAYPMATDTAGRILIQKPLLEYAGINNDVLMLAMDTKIEIWSPERYHATMMSPQDFSELANSVLGGDDTDLFQINP